MSHTKKTKKGQRTARLILPNGYPFIQLYSDQYLNPQSHNNQSACINKQKYDKPRYEKDQGQTNSNNDHLTYELNNKNISCYSTSNTDKNENNISILSDNTFGTKMSISDISSDPFRCDHIPRFFEIKGKGSLPTISFVKGKVILS